MRRKRQCGNLAAAACLGADTMQADLIKLKDKIRVCYILGRMRKCSLFTACVKTEERVAESWYDSSWMVEDLRVGATVD